MEFFIIASFVILLILLRRTSRLRSGIDEIKLNQRLIKEKISFLTQEMKTSAPARKKTEEKKPAETVIPAVSTPPEPKPPAGKVEPAPLPTPAHTEKKKEPWSAERIAALKKEEPAARTKVREPLLPDSAFVRSAKEILGKIWNWILVGEEHRDKNIMKEYAIASTWLTRSGIVILVFGIVYFIGWSIKNGYINDVGRVALSMILGIGMLGWGIRMIGKKYHMLGEGFIGGGLLILYYSAYAAGPRFELIDVYAAFALMILLTLTSATVSIKYNSLLIAIIGIAGAYGTPVMLNEAGGNLPVLYSYILLLNIGILGIARYREWHLLNYIAFAGSYFLFFSSFGCFGGQFHLHTYHTEEFPLVFSFLTTFFIVHSATGYIHNIAGGKVSTTLDIGYLVGNALIYSATGYHMIHDAYGRPYPALMSAFLAAFYIAHVYLFISKKTVDRPLVLSLIALAGAFTAWTMPLVLENESLTIAFSILAFTFLWIGSKLSSNFIAHLGYGLYIIVFFKMMLFDLERNFSLTPVPPENMSEYWKEMFQRLLTFGSAIGSVFAGFFFQRKHQPPRRAVIELGNDTPVIVEQELSRNIFYWVGLLFGFMVLHLEISTMLMYLTPFRLPFLTGLWCLMAFFFLYRYTTEGSRSPVLFFCVCIFTMGAIIKLFIFDLAFWRFSEGFIYNEPYSALHGFARMIDFWFILAILYAGWSSATKIREHSTPAKGFGYTGLLMLFIYCTLELNSFLFWKLKGFQDGGISILWALFAIGFISIGIWKEARPLRYAGLALFAVVAVKIFVVDLKGMEVIYRVIGFTAVGIVLLLGSFAYLRSGGKFIMKPENNQ